MRGLCNPDVYDILPPLSNLKRTVKQKNQHGIIALKGHGSNARLASKTEIVHVAVADRC